MPRKYPNMVSRLLANSREDTDTPRLYGRHCRVWMGKTKRNRAGMLYGVLNVRVARGPDRGKIKTELAHRVALRAFKGVYLGKTKVGKHLCDNSLCIEQRHLRAGTQRSNVRECVARGRHRSPFKVDTRAESCL